MKVYKLGEAYAETVKNCTTFVKSEKKILEAFVAEARRVRDRMYIDGETKKVWERAIHEVMGRYP